VAVLNHEWSYGYAPTGSGMYPCEPGQNPQYQFRETVDLGTTFLTKQEIKAAILRLKDEWPGSSYDVLQRNCCHFCEAFARELRCKDPPAWLNRLAQGADATIAFTNDAVELASRVSSSVSGAASTLSESVRRLWTAGYTATTGIDGNAGSANGGDRSSARAPRSTSAGSASGHRPERAASGTATGAADVGGGAGEGGGGRATSASWLHAGASGRSTVRVASADGAEGVRGSSAAAGGLPPLPPGGVHAAASAGSRGSGGGLVAWLRGGAGLRIESLAEAPTAGAGAGGVGSTAKPQSRRASSDSNRGTDAGSDASRGSAAGGGATRTLPADVLAQSAAAAAAARAAAGQGAGLHRTSSGAVAAAAAAAAAVATAAAAARTPDDRANSRAS
ncbi:hypothetical protein FOA52_012506, partial [Chlamydomonas sp. UWO 241]